MRFGLTESWVQTEEITMASVQRLSSDGRKRMIIGYVMELTMKISRAEEFSGIDMRDVLLYRISNISNNYRFRRQQL